MKNDINRWIFEIPVDDVKTTNDDTTVTGGCFLCGKPIKSKKYFIHLLTPGMLVSSDQEFDNDQGFFEIGSECRKRIPNNFYFEATDETI